MYACCGPCRYDALAGVSLQDEKGARKEASAFVARCLLTEAQDSFVVHDLLLDFIDVMCQHERSVVQQAVMRQTHYLSRLPVVWRYCRKEEFLEGMYSLISLWRPVMKLSGNEKQDVEAYEASLRELGEEHEPIDLANACMIIGDVFLLQVRSMWGMVSASPVTYPQESCLSVNYSASRTNEPCGVVGEPDNSHRLAGTFCGGLEE